MLRITEILTNDNKPTIGPRPKREKPVVARRSMATTRRRRPQEKGARQEGGCQEGSGKAARQADAKKAPAKKAAAKSDKK